jgi:predicted nucleic acid-binding protein
MEKTIIDTPIWIGHHWERDSWKIPSKKIIQAFIYGKIHNVHVTDYVIVETVNFLLRRGSYPLAKAALEAFQADRIKIRHVDKLFFQKSKQWFDKYPNLSITDASLIALAEEQNIKTVFSFDALFDTVKEVQRLKTFCE